MRVLIAGSTTWTDEEAIRRELAHLPPDAVVLHGDCAGADAIGGRLAAEEFGLTVEPFAKNPEDRRLLGRLAWQRLNERMLASGVDLVLAFHPDLAHSRGTGHLVRLANEAGVAVRHIAG